MKCLLKGDRGYDEACEISNARFNYEPRKICYCENASEVSALIKTPELRNAGVRIRSGGHQHEGMCTANGVVLIDLSPINKIEYLSGDRAWIGAGMSLTDAYALLWHRSYIFPGGGCGDVHVGGLTQGGGWGPQGRLYGLTCDSLIGVEMVDANGDIVTAMGNTDKERGLLRALRGGGGGNFGVVTKFCFRLHRWAGEFTNFTLGWSDRKLPPQLLDPFIQQWMKAFPRDADLNLTSFLRLSALDEKGGDRVVIGGRYVGSPEQARARMNALLEGQPGPDTKEDYKPIQRILGAEAAEPSESDLAVLRDALGTLAGYQPGPAIVGAAEAKPPDLSDTCAGVPLRHKISSGFVRRPFDPDLVRFATRFILRESHPTADRRLYLSFHSLGGAMDVKGDDSSYAFRDRDVLLQFQAWWLPRDTGDDPIGIKWVGDFRRAMSVYTDGAFINFVDRDIPLQEYYQGTFDELIAAKQAWDPGDLFKFEMSIPRKR